MDTIEKAIELLEKRIFSIKGVTGIGVVDYEGNGKKKIEVAVSNDDAHKEVKEITEENYFKNYIISIIFPGETEFFN